MPNQRIEPLLGSPGGDGNKRLNFPISFKTFLRLAVGGRTYKYRVELFRRYWRDKLKFHAEIRSAAFTDSTEEAIAKFKRDGIDAGELGYHTMWFADWRRKMVARTASENAKNGWVKRKSKKSIDTSKKRKSNIPLSSKLNSASTKAAKVPLCIPKSDIPHSQK